MRDITHKQHVALEKMCQLYGSAGILKKSGDEDIEVYWELVRAGYLNNLVTMAGAADWHFVFTLKGDKYVGSHCDPALTPPSQETATAEGE